MAHLDSRPPVGVLAWPRVAPPIASARSSEHGPLAQDTWGRTPRRERKRPGEPVRQDKGPTEAGGRGAEPRARAPEGHGGTYRAPRAQPLAVGDVGQRGVQAVDVVGGDAGVTAQQLSAVLAYSTVLHVVVLFLLLAFLPLLLILLLLLLGLPLYPFLLLEAESRKREVEEEGGRPESWGEAKKTESQKCTDVSWGLPNRRAPLSKNTDSGDKGLNERTPRGFQNPAYLLLRSPEDHNRKQEEGRWVDPEGTGYSHSGGSSICPQEPGQAQGQGRRGGRHEGRCRTE